MHTAHSDRTKPKPSRRRGWATAALAGVVAALGVTLAAPGVANAEAYSCNRNGSAGGVLSVHEFSIQTVDTLNYLVTVEVLAAMPQADAQTFIDRSGDYFLFNLWEDDPSSDDLVTKWAARPLMATPDGLLVRSAHTVSYDDLHGHEPAYESGEEWYVGAHFFDNRGSFTDRAVETCRLTTG